MNKNFRIFSLEEANSLLPEVEMLLQRLDGKRQEHARLHDEHFLHELLAESERRRGIQNSAEPVDSGARWLEQELEAVAAEVEAIRALGCFVRNIDRGWIDFAGRHKGEMIYFCWHRGEKDIRFFHPFKGPLTERRPLFSE